MNKTRAKLPKPLKIDRKLTLSKEMLAELTGGAPPVAEAMMINSFGFNAECALYTC